MATQSRPNAVQALRCGVLVIGSLYWKEDRAGWRMNRLDLAKTVEVSTRIRYGRRSAGWGDTFTMVMDSAAPDGRGLLVPCKGEVTSFADLLEEVHCLWAAEANQPQSDRFYRGWGCVGALFAPRAVAEGFSALWGDHFRAAKPEIPPVLGPDGVLALTWPHTLEDAPVAGVDIILATATMPNPEGERPAARDIAGAWIEQTNGHERYFMENRRHGIRTADDREIWAAIEHAQPHWLNRDVYADVVRDLRSEADANLPDIDKAS